MTAREISLFTMDYGLRALNGPVSRLPDGIAIVDGEREVEWHELRDESLARASEAIDAASPGANVGIEVSSPAGFAAALFGCMLAGRVAVPIDGRLDASLRDSLVADCEHVMQGPTTEFKARQVEVLADEDEPALRLLTSGTAGTPSPVTLSHGNLRAQAEWSGRALSLVGDDRWLSALPLSHAGGVGVLLRSLAWGSTAVLRSSFNAAEAVSLLADPDERVSLVSLVPTTLSRLLDEGLQGPPTLRRAVIGGAPLVATLRDRALRCGVPVVESWGMTQTCGMATLARSPGDLGAGEPIGCVEVAVGTENELFVRGESVCAEGISDDGWLHTGDVGAVDGGSVSVTGRLSSIVITGGENVMPERVERAALELGSFRAALAYGVPDEQWGERLVLELVPDGPIPHVGAIRDQLRAVLAPFEVPKEIMLVDRIVTGESGKPLRQGRGLKES